MLSVWYVTQNILTILMNTLRDLQYKSHASGQARSPFMYRPGWETIGLSLTTSQVTMLSLVSHRVSPSSPLAFAPSRSHPQWLVLSNHRSQQLNAIHFAGHPPCNAELSRSLRSPEVQTVTQRFWDRFFSRWVSLLLQPESPGTTFKSWCPSTDSFRGAEMS